jgi:hypothetical protein
MQEARAAQAMVADAKPQRRAPDEEARVGALASEPSETGRESETQTAQSQKPVDSAAKHEQAADSAIAQVQHSLQQEQEKAEQQRSALDEAQGRAATLASEPVGTGRESEPQTTQSPKPVDAVTKQEQAADSHIGNVTQAAKTAVTAPPEAADAQGNAEAAKLIARASALLGQGNIGAARVVLERASEAGSAMASFMLAETYDPAVLTAWGTYGTRGEMTKARELYRKAQAGGIEEAKNRLNALRQ